jgi:hypothetical protein
MRVSAIQNDDHAGEPCRSAVNVTRKRLFGLAGLGIGAIGIVWLAIVVLTHHISYSFESVSPGGGKVAGIAIDSYLTNNYFTAVAATTNDAGARNDWVRLHDTSTFEAHEVKWLGSDALLVRGTPFPGEVLPKPFHSTLLGIDVSFENTMRSER